MFIPYFNTPDNYHKYRRDLKIANGHCLNCSKPLTYKAIYCTGCTRSKLFMNGFEDRRITIGQAGRNVINYQQYLHRAIFNCNAHIDYRGKKEDRIKVKVSNKAIITAKTRLNRVLSCSKYTYLGKTYTSNKHNLSVYNQIKNVRNINKRLLYNILLYYISYHIENNHQFKTFVHFQTSMLNNILINIQRTHVRVNRPVDFRQCHEKRTANTAKYWYWLFGEVDSLIKPLMNEVIDSINK